MVFIVKIRFEDFEILKDTLRPSEVENRNDAVIFEKILASQTSYHLDIGVLKIL